MAKRYLLDTNVFLFLAQSPQKLPKRVRALLSEESATIQVSIISGLEIAIKVGLHKLIFPLVRLEEVVSSMGGELLTLQTSHLIKLATLPQLHRDPFDRLLIAQAVEEESRLVTTDALLAQYGIDILLAD